MSLVFCRACGKEIHESAIACPQCGAPQTPAAGPKTVYHWSAIVAFVTGILVMLVCFAEPDGKWDQDAVLGGFVFGCVPVIFGIITLTRHPETSRWMAITGIVLGAFAILISLGSK